MNLNSNKMFIIGSDHAGYELKDNIINFFKKENIEFIDVGVKDINPSDYPDLAHDFCEKMKLMDIKSGVLICGSGIGMSITANRHQKIRAALCLNEKMVKLSRKHNNANVLVLGSRLISSEEAIKCIKCFIQTPFEAGRHLTRVNKIDFN